MATNTKGWSHYRHRVPGLRVGKQFQIHGRVVGRAIHERELFHSYILFPTICHTLYGREEIEGATHPIELSNAK